jgi:hypothetical protein
VLHRPECLDDGPADKPGGLPYDSHREQIDFSFIIVILRNASPVSRYSSHLAHHNTEKRVPVCASDCVRSLL